MRTIYIGIQSISSEHIRSLFQEYCRDNDVELDFHGYDYQTLNDDPLLYHDLKMRSKDADFILVSCMADPDRFNRFQEYIASLNCSKTTVFIFVGNAEIRETYRHLFNRSDEEYRALVECLNHKGTENELKILGWMIDVYSGNYAGPPKATIPDDTGIYHGGRLYLEDADEYLDELEPDKPRVGIVIDSGSWIYKDLSSADCLIESLEGAGMSTIPILFSNMVSKGHDLYRSSKDVLCRYFVRDGKPLVDTVLVCSGFSLLVNSKTGGTGPSTPDSENYLLNDLNVPLIHIMTVRRHVEYSEDVKGMEKSELFTQVVWPEVDGQIISVPFSMRDGERTGMTAPI